MSVFSQLSLKAKVLLLPITFLVSLIAIGLLVSATISKIKVGGPEYAKIQEQKDLLADTIPPPGYVLEAYLNLHLMENAASETERDRCIERFYTCRADFEKCQAKWDVSLPKGEVHSLFTVEAHLPAKEFFRIAVNEFIPAVKAGDSEKVASLLLPDSPLVKSYAKHASTMDALVSATENSLSKAEVSVRNLIATRNWALFFGILAVTVAVWHFGVGLSLHIEARKLDF